MFRMNSLRAAGLAIAIIFSPTLILAQAGQAEGTVKLNAEGGSKKPVPGATVDIYRTDIKGHWTVKTDKGGHFVILGLPLSGAFLFLASGPGLQPTWVNNVHITQTPVVDIIVEPGDGQTMTLEQVQQAIAGQKSGGGGQPAPARTLSAADRAKLEAAQKEQQSKIKESQEIQASFDEAVKHFNEGVKLKNASNYQAAVSEFEQATTLDPSKNKHFVELGHKANAQLAESHYQLGADLFNQKDKKGARPHFEQGVAAANKAIALVANMTDNPNLNSDLITYYGILVRNAQILIENYGDASPLDDTVKAIDKAQSIDPQNKNKWVVLKAKLYFAAGRSDEAVTEYKSVLAADPNNLDALFGLGLALVATGEKAHVQEGVNYLADFVSKAPSTDKRVADVKSQIDDLKKQQQIEPEKPAKRRKP